MKQTDLLGSTHLESAKKTQFEFNDTTALRSKKQSIQESAHMFEKL